MVRIAVVVVGLLVVAAPLSGQADPLSTIELTPAYPNVPSFVPPFDCIRFAEIAKAVIKADEQFIEPDCFTHQAAESHDQEKTRIVARTWQTILISVANIYAATRLVMDSFYSTKAAIKTFEAAVKGFKKGDLSTTAFMLSRSADHLQSPAARSDRLLTHSFAGRSSLSERHLLVQKLGTAALSFATAMEDAAIDATNQTAQLKMRFGDTEIFTLNGPELVEYAEAGALPSAPGEHDDDQVEEAYRQIYGMAAMAAGEGQPAADEYCPVIDAPESLDPATLYYRAQNISSGQQIQLLGMQAESRARLAVIDATLEQEESRRQSLIEMHAVLVLSYIY